MKFKMSESEFNSFCAQLAKSGAFTHLQELEEELKEARSDLGQAIDSRCEAWSQLDRTNEENRELRRVNEDVRRVNEDVQREIRNLRREIEIMIEQAKPFFRERGFSRMFGLFRAGQKIHCIKEVREVMKLDLKSAKDVVEGAFVDGTRPEVFALCKVFAGITGGLPHDALCEELYKVVKTLSVDDMNRVLHGEFHVEADVKF